MFKAFVQEIFLYRHVTGASITIKTVVHILISVTLCSQKTILKLSRTEVHTGVFVS